MQALGKADDTLHTVSVAIVEERKAKDPNKFCEAKLEAWEKFYEAIDDFDQKRALALIVCGKQMNDTLMSLKQELRGLGFKLREGEVDSYEDSEPDLAPIFARAFASARHELGIVRGSDSDK